MQELIGIKSEFRLVSYTITNKYPMSNNDEFRRKENLQTYVIKTDGTNTATVIHVIYIHLNLRLTKRRFRYTNPWKS